MAAAEPAERLADRVRIEADGTVTVFTGKVELGQGALTALQQIAAEELCVPFDRVHLVSGHTDESPDEGYTAGSRSVQVGGAAIGAACADAFDRLRGVASERLGGAAEPDHDGAFHDSRGGRLRYPVLAPAIDWTAPVRASASPRPREAHRWVGRSVPRIDLAGKLRGGAFIHDLVFDGMLHGRVLRPPQRGARLLAFDADRVRRAAGVVAMTQDGSFVGVLALREEHAIAAVALAARACAWEAAPPGTPGGDPFAFGEPLLLRTQQVGTREPGAAPVRELSAVYERPFIAHASIGPSCALARFDAAGERLEVWTHSQGVFQLRGELARALDWRPERIDVRHVQGSGCYGHNGADDVAFDAVLLARSCPGTPVRVQWSRADELGWSPVGSAMRTRIAATIDAQGKVVDWQVDIDSGTHMNRPGASTDTLHLLAAACLAEPAPPGAPLDTALEQGGGGDRNAIALYALPAQTVRYRLHPQMPLRTSSLRGLGAYCNVFAIESFIDELAEALAEDAVALRLRYLADPRARAVVAAAAAMAEPPAPGRAIGCGFARYKNVAAYCAVFAEVEVEADVQLTRVWCAVDAGLAINPDGLVNQIEGGIVQSASWTLKEQVAWVSDSGGSGSRITSTDWDGYPILRFSEVPEIVVQVIDAHAHPPLGVGEAAQGPTAAAIANAVTRALGIRPRRLPLTRDALMALAQEA
jgi:CO/xanthine dehydrogenase Mo-binding subunit